VQEAVPDGGAESTSKSLGRPVLYAVILLALYLSYQVLEPFFVALTWAAMFAILFHRMQVALVSRMGPNRAALVTTLVVAIAIVAPAVVVISAVVREAPGLADYLKRASSSAPEQIQRIWDTVRARSPVSLPDDPTDLVTRGVQRTLTFLAPRAGGVVADVLGTLGTLGAMLFALFFMLRDGEAMSRRLRDRLPFSRDDSDRLLHETRELVIASVGAGLVVSAVQGLLGGVAFWLVDISAPVFWGVLTAFCSLLPVVGAALVWVPAAIYLLLSGEIGRGVIMFLVGALGISMADNVLRPLLLSGRTSVSGLVIFFGLLGGVAAFGFTGIVVGPIVLVTAGRLFDIMTRRAPADDFARPLPHVNGGVGNHTAE
jgi:predicted PurR-regulated permease PerM